MKKIILIPDSFKGTMSSSEICTIMERALHKWYPDTEITGVPVADGGEGSVDAFLTAVVGQPRPAHEGMGVLIPLRYREPGRVVLL